MWHKQVQHQYLNNNERSSFKFSCHIGSARVLFVEIITYRAEKYTLLRNDRSHY